MGSLALRPGDSLTILLDGFVNGLQDSQFPSFLPFKLRGSDSYPGGTLTHCSCQPSLDAHFPVLLYCVHDIQGGVNALIAWRGARPQLQKNFTQNEIRWAA
jgi:hypothetical protein